MYLTIVLRKEVPDIATAQQLVDFVKEKVEPYPEVTVTGNVGEQLKPTEVIP